MFDPNMPPLNFVVGEAVRSGSWLTIDRATGYVCAARTSEDAHGQMIIGHAEEDLPAKARIQID